MLPRHAVQPTVAAFGSCSVKAPSSCRTAVNFSHHGYSLGGSLTKTSRDDTMLSNSWQISRFMLEHLVAMIEGKSETLSTPF